LVPTHIARIKMKEQRLNNQESIWIYGINPVLEALQGDASGVAELLVARKSLDQRLRPIEEQAGKHRIALRHLSREALSALVGHEHHQGVALRLQGFAYADPDRFLAQQHALISPLVVLDSIQDPQNLGAILRSSCFLGAKGVVIPKDRAAAVSSTVIKVAAGATAHLPIMRVTNLVRLLEQLKELGLWIAGLDPQGKQSVYDADLTMPVALVVGNEQKGLRPLVRNTCDLLLQIPAGGPLQSLNAATACAIALAEMQRQRGCAKVRA
jgi:23S rRNA (guanosine2251-2'-O)-methyltransferase